MENETWWQYILRDWFGGRFTKHAPKFEPCNVVAWGDHKRVVFSYDGFQALCPPDPVEPVYTLVREDGSTTVEAERNLELWDDYVARRAEMREFYLECAAQER